VVCSDGKVSKRAEGSKEDALVNGIGTVVMTVVERRFVRCRGTCW
jgi:hypothetical protein